MDSQFRKSVTLKADKGLWSDDAGDGLRMPQDAVFASENMLFINNLPQSRPGLITAAIDGVEGLIFAKSFNAGAIPGSIANPDANFSDYNLLFQSASYRRFLFDPIGHTVGYGTAITGPAFTRESVTDTGVAFVNLDLIVGGKKTAGAVGLHDFTGPTTYVEITGQDWYFTLGHKSRLIVALQNAVGDGDYQVAWTVPGTVTDFTNFGSGFVTLADALDTITGLVSIRDIPVIARGGGFTLMNPTGQADPAYSLDNFTRESNVGCRWPETLASDNIRCFFVGDDNVYVFNLSQIYPIGDPIKRQLIDALATYGLYRGCILTSTGKARRRYYCLAPLKGTAASPIFLYDIKDAQGYKDMEEGTWSTLYTDKSMRAGMFTQANSQTNTNIYNWMVSFLDSDHNLNVMLRGTLCEKTPTLQWGPIQVSQSKVDYRVMNCYASFLCKGPGGTITLRVECIRGLDNTQLLDDYQEVVLGQADSGSLPQCIVFRVDEVGNYFRFTLTFPAGNDIIFDLLQVDFAESGDKR